MHKTKNAFLALMVVLMSSLTFTTANADLITAEYSWNFGLSGGVDTLGLDGAVGILSMTFDTNDQYIERFGLPAADAVDHSLSIFGSGADGSYQEADGIAIYATFSSGVFFGGGAANGFAEFDIAGATLQMATGLVEDSGLVISVGDFIDISHFSTALFAGGAFSYFGDGSDYLVENFSGSVSVNAVPEPGSLALLVVGLFGMGLGLRKKI